MFRSGANIHELTGPPSKSPVQLAAAGGHLEVMEEMSKYISSQDWKKRDDWGWTLLHEVAHNGHPEVTICSYKSKSDSRN